MNLKDKTIGIVFINDPEIKEDFIYELIKLQFKNDINIIPIVKELYYKQNIDVFSKITKNKPIFYNNGIILDKTVKKLDILILVGCSNKIIYKIANKKFDNNILKIVKQSMIKKIPILIGINIKNFNSVSLKNIEYLLDKKEYYFIPFKITNPVTDPKKVSFDYCFFIKTIYLSLENIQIEPIMSIF